MLISSERARGSANEINTSFAVRDTAERSKHRTSWIGRLFQAAFKAVTQRDEDAPQPSKRRRGEKDGGGPTMFQAQPPPAHHAGRPAARGRYATLRTGTTKSAGQGRGHEAHAALHLTDTLDWLQLWQDNNTGHWPDDNFSAKQNQYFPQP
jgi:hypothetical protein